MSKGVGAEEEAYDEISIDIFGEPLRKISCPRLCDRFCGRSCVESLWHEGSCLCGTDCASDVGPFDHLVPLIGALPVREMDDADTEPEPDKFFLPPPQGYGNLTRKGKP